MSLVAWAESRDLPADGGPTLDLASRLGLRDPDVMAHFEVDFGTGTVGDDWGRPIWLRPSDDVGFALLVSRGPDGKDDGGDGDDITIPMTIHDPN